MKFNPENYNFTYINKVNDCTIWRTQPVPDYIIGCYRIEYSNKDDWWDIYEIYRINELDKDICLYSGRIPNGDFGYQLLLNMEIEVPVIQRELKIDKIL
jgi:hypothetical protein